MNIKALNIPEPIRREIEDFAAEVERRTRGQVSDDDFKRFRLQQGVYGQRQADLHMVRTKLPQGRYNADQLLSLADFADRYSNGILHVTTRQDIQFHFVKIQDVPEGLQLLAEHGLTTREACGNTVRNVTACHKAGTCANELFDVSPYGAATTQYLLRHPLTQNLPRKFKISFGGCHGCGLAPIHDIGFNAVMRGDNGKSSAGFRVVFGGGLGSTPRAAQPLMDFLPVADTLRMCEAVIRVFDKHGDKRNRNKARLKYVLDKLGADKTRALVLEEFKSLEGKSYPAIEPARNDIPATAKIAPDARHDADPEFRRWKECNTLRQRQADFLNVQIKLTLGDLKSAEARAVARIAADCAAGQLVNTVHQNIMIPWVKDEALGAVFGELKKIGLHKAGTEQLRDVTCCPGSETCNLGITHSRGLASELTEKSGILPENAAELNDISVKISGCPNSCGQHHIADIGFHGGAKKVNGILAPHYEMMLGGRISENQAVFGESVIKIPAKNIPDAVRRTLEDYRKEKLAGESFFKFFERKGKGHFVNLLDDLKNLPNIEQSPESYIDYHATGRFSLEDRGQGECAGAVTDMIQDHLSVAERTLFQSRQSLEKSQFRDAVEQANRSIVASARALLVTEGMDFTEDLETMVKFESLVVDTGIVSEEYSGIARRFSENLADADSGMADRRKKEAESILEQSRNAYLKMKGDKSLRLRVGPGAGPEATAPAPRSESINLLGVKCPFNYVKTKLKLETMASGSRLEVLLDDGEPVRNVPRSVQNDGHKLLALDKVENHYRMVIEKA